MAWQNYMTQAVLQQFPEALPGVHFTWVSTDDGPEMQGWDADFFGGDFVIGDWEARCVASARAQASNLVSGAHAAMLAELSGGATVEERDTWPNQKDWVSDLKSLGRFMRLARIITAALPDTADDMQPLLDEVQEEIGALSSKLVGLLTEQEIAALQGAGASPSDAMAARITAKVEAMDLLIVKSTRIKRTADAGISAAQTVEELEGLISGLSDQANAARVEFQEAIAG